MRTGSVRWHTQRFAWMVRNHPNSGTGAAQQVLFGFISDSDTVAISVSPMPAKMSSRHRAYYPLFEERFVCVYDAAVLGPAGRAGGLSKAQYFATPHVVRATDGATGTLFDEQFEAAGHRRVVAATSATFLAASMAVQGQPPAGEHAGSGA